MPFFKTPSRTQPAQPRPRPGRRGVDARGTGLPPPLEIINSAIALTFVPTISGCTAQSGDSVSC